MGHQSIKPFGIHDAAFTVGTYENNTTDNQDSDNTGLLGLAGLRLRGQNTLTSSREVIAKSPAPVAR